MSDIFYLRERPWRHGYRVEGSYILKKFGVFHIFFKSEIEALESLTSGDKPT